MSYGYSRTPSPAQKSAAERARGGRRFKLSRLALDEVSLVNRAACPGATVQIVKGYKMQTEMTLRQQLQAALDDGDVTKAAVITKGIALQDFPESKNWGVALSKWQSTAEGAAVTAAIARIHYAKEQFRTATGNGYGIDQIAEKSMDPGDWDEMVADKMKKLGCNRSRAIDEVLRDKGGPDALRKSLVFYNPPAD
jgi:hypothetical protein